MPDRRDFLIGAGLVGVAGAAQALIPRRQISLLGAAKIDALLPKRVPGFAAVEGGSVIAPPAEGSLADRLYSETAQRVFETPAGDYIMLLAAYGSTQSDQLQLHRPESCYPAVGFNIGNGGNRTIALAIGLTVPVRRLSAQLDQRVEQIAYWTRIGEFLPQSAADQRSVRLRNALDGVVADGILVRVSSLVSEPERGDEINAAFIQALVGATPPAGRRVLLGSRYASAASG